MANAIEQIGAVTAMNLRNIPQRLSSSLVAVLGIGGVSLVLVALLSIGAGFTRALEGSGQEDVAMILRAGAPSEMGSYFGQPEITAVTNASGIRRNDKNELMVSPEIFGIIAHKMAGKDSDAQLPLRGVGPLGPQLRKAFKLTPGSKMFRPGTNEIIVGAGAVKQYEGLGIGKTVRWLKTDWTVVGHFTDDGGLAESEVWADAGTLQQVWQRGPTVSTIRAKLAEGTSAKALKDQLTKSQMTVDAPTEKQFYSDQQKILRTLINRVGVTIAIIMGLAALFAALNTLESAVASRVREIATLRAIGFGAGPVVFSVLVEAMLLGAIGGLLGGLVAFAFLNGITSSTLNFASFSQITYAFTVTPLVMAMGIAYGLALCLLAGILPGIRAARMPITSGLREL
jgi:putative ABC transport system permease protein